MILDDRDDASLLEEIRQLVQSKYWKMVRTYLLNRRAQLFAAEHPSTEQLWKGYGALHEINRLLHAPEEALFEMARVKIEGEPLPDELRPFGLNGTQGDQY